MPGAGGQKGAAAAVKAKPGKLIFPNSGKWGASFTTMAVLLADGGAGQIRALQGWRPVQAGIAGRRRDLILRDAPLGLLSMRL